MDTLVCCCFCVGGINFIVLVVVVVDLNLLLSGQVVHQVLGDVGGRECMQRRGQDNP